jgi:hypothetical protein
LSDSQPPTLPQYPAPGLRVADRKEAAPFIKLMGKLMAKRMPRLGKNPNIHSQSVTIKHKKKKDDVPYY